MQLNDAESIPEFIRLIGIVIVTVLFQNGIHHQRLRFLGPGRIFQL